MRKSTQKAFAGGYKGRSLAVGKALRGFVLFLALCPAIALLSPTGVRAETEANADADGGTDCDPPGKQRRPKAGRRQ
jgi:hypothetical protein